MNRVSKKEKKAQQNNYEQFKKDRDSLHRLTLSDLLSSKKLPVEDISELVDKLMRYISTQPETDQERLCLYLEEKAIALFRSCFQGYITLQRYESMYLLVRQCADVFSKISQKTVPQNVILTKDFLFSPEEREQYKTYLLQKLVTYNGNARRYVDLYTSMQEMLLPEDLQKDKEKYKKIMRESIWNTFAQADSLSSATYASLEWHGWAIIRLWLLDQKEYIRTIAECTQAYLARKTVLIKKRVSEMKDKDSYIGSLKSTLQEYLHLLAEQWQNALWIKEGISAWKELFKKSDSALTGKEVKDVLETILQRGVESMNYLSDKSITWFFVHTLKLYTSEEWSRLCEEHRQRLEAKKKK